ncbi:centrosome assembly protein spindle defective 2 [Arctopsyche grandis]|uniref:centrosome assembly protein spindle defective 2 n=1 Tax=Arctopsyche grandis TaxID=121162 RepID=UPI00406D8648
MDRQKDSLEIPKVRRSVEIVSQSKKAPFDNTLGTIYSPCATSTVEKRGYESLTGLPSQYFKQRSTVDASNDSSLGILDIDDYKGIGEDISRKSNLRSKSPSDSRFLSFNPQEISARSTNFNKENDNPNAKISSICPQFSGTSFANAVNSVQAIIEKAKNQSISVDEILKSSDVPAANNMRMSLQVLKDPRKNNSKRNSSWNHCSQSLGFDGMSATNTENSIRDSMFASKINMSEEELEWMKDNADLPVNPQSLMNNSKILEETSPPTNEFGSRSRNFSPLSDSKMSVGNYFEQRSDNINHILLAPSPDKKYAQPLIRNTEDTYVKQNHSLRYSTCNKNTISKPSLQNISENLEPSNGSIDKQIHTSEKFQKHEALLDSLNGDDTLTANPLSLTQIRNFVGKMETESPSLLLDHMLGEKTKKISKTTVITKPSTTTSNSFQPNGSNLSPAHLFGHTSDMFHSTKNDLATTTNNIKSQTNKGKHSIKLSPVSKLKSPNKQQNDTTDQQYSTSNYTSTLKNSTKSTTSNTTDNTLKSINTVVNACQKYSNLDIKSQSRDGISPLKVAKLKSHCELSPGILSSSYDKSYNGALTPSDVSKEIKDLMSPSSVNCTETSINTPTSGRVGKRLLDLYPNAKSPKVDDDGWISPCKARINNLGRNSIVTTSPLKNDDNKTKNSYNLEPSLDVPVEGDWIKIKSTEEDIVVGIPNELNLKVESLGSRCLSVQILINEIYVDDKLLTDDTFDMIRIQECNAKYLEAYTKTNWTLEITSWLLNRNIVVNLSIGLADIITKTTTVLNHRIKIRTRLPKISMQSANSNAVNGLEFPTIPKEWETSMSVILWNESTVDVPLQLNVRNTKGDVFEITNIEVVPEDVAEERFRFYSQKQSLSTSKDLSTLQKEYVLPHNKKAALIALIVFDATKLDNDNIQSIEGVLDISFMIKNKSTLIQSVPIMASIGTTALLLRNSQKSDTVTISSGSMEVIEMFNAGSIPMDYNIYIASSYNKDPISTSISLIPCEENIFKIDQTHVTLRPDEKTSIRITCPHNDALQDIRRALVFETLYTTEIVDLIGTSASSRCPSQQSAYSVESVSSQVQEAVLKSTKKELSWGSLKVGEGKSRDITFKNVATAKKMRVIVTVIGEGFKVLSDNGVVSSLMFTLQPQECRSLHLEFKPTRIGGFTGTLRIAKRYNPNSRDNQTNEPRLLFKAPLHGIGGQSKLVFKDGVFRHAGSQGLPLGSLNNSGPNKQIYFTIWNKGSTLGFVLFNIELKWKYRNLGDEVFVTPNQVIVKPGETIRCAVNIPRRAASLASGRAGDTEAIASLAVLHGDEAARLRIKKIYSNHIKDDSSAKMWNEKCQGKLKSLCEKFPEEDANYSNIGNFKESTDVLLNLLDELQQKEVMLTYDLDLDYSIACLSNNLDETLHFQTVNEDMLESTLLTDLSN